jgi:hypothetical protein
MGYNKTLRKICIVFFAVVAVLTFFSQTLSDMRIPRVTLAFVEEGRITREAVSSGVLEPANTEIIFAPVSGTIVQIEERGYRGSALDALFAIQADMQSLQRRLEEAQDEQRLIALNTERTQNAIALERQHIDRLTADMRTGRASELFGYDLQLYEIQLAENDRLMRLARENLREQRDLYDDGLADRQSVNQARSAVTALDHAREQILVRRQQAETEHEQSIAAGGQSREAQIGLHEAAILQQNVQLRIHDMEAQRVQRRISELSEQIEHGGLTKIYGVGNRTILEIMPGIGVGALVSEGAAVMNTAFRDFHFRVEANFTQPPDFWNETPRAVITARGMEFSARVVERYNEGESVRVVIEVNEALLSAEGRVMITLSRFAQTYKQVIPRSALREGAQGPYILYLEAEERPFGMRYYVRSHQVFEIQARNDTHAAVWMFDFDESMPIIINSDMPVYVGDRARPVSAGDFIGSR